MEKYFIGMINRNKEITHIINLLETAWHLHPEYRLGQLVSNLLGPGPHDVFFPTDEDWEKYLRKFIKDVQKGKY